MFAWHGRDLSLPVESIVPASIMLSLTIRHCHIWLLAASSDDIYYLEQIRKIFMLCLQAKLPRIRCSYTCLICIFYDILNKHWYLMSIRAETWLIITFWLSGSNNGNHRKYLLHELRILKVSIYPNFLYILILDYWKLYPYWMLYINSCTLYKPKDVYKGC